FMPFGHGPERGDELYQLAYFLFGGALPLSRPEGLPVVPGQFPPCPGWLDGPRLPVFVVPELPDFDIVYLLVFVVWLTNMAVTYTAIYQI
ncbi:hypothetical protein ACOZZ2_004100, partial [Cronobacter turicensis]